MSLHRPVCQDFGSSLAFEYFSIIAGIWIKIARKEITMSRILLGAGVWLTAAAGLVTAGQISGRITDNGRPLPERTKVAVTCGSSVKESETDRFGSYRVFQPPNGQCTLVVYGYKGARGSVVSYPDPVTFDFELVRNSDGTYFLRRR